MRDFAGPSQATLLGRGERIDALNAALLNGIASNILDFDDTHLRTVIHPTVPVASALATMLLAILLVPILLFQRVQQRELEDQ